MVLRHWMRLACCFWALLGAQAAWAVDPFTWQTDAVPTLPLPMQAIAVGTHNGALLVAGGVTPDPLADIWKYLETIYALEPGDTAWHEAGKLPGNLAGAAAASDTSGVYLVGGQSADGDSNAILRLEYRAGQVQVQTLPVQLPVGAWATGATVYRGRLYLGGQVAAENPPGSPTKVLISLDLAHPDAGWVTNNQMPGSATATSIVAAGPDGVYVMGEMQSTRARAEFGFCYSPGAGWRSIATPPHIIGRVPALGFGPAHLLALGSGVTGPDAHNLLGYERITNTWTTLGTLPDIRTHTQAVQWNGMIVVPGGMRSEGDQYVPALDTVLSGTPNVRANGFGFVDYLVVGLYLLAMIGMGLYFSQREKTTEAFFLGGRAVPWWAAGLSIFGTSISSITYLAIPAKAYASDWVFLVGNLTILLIAPLITLVYIPAFRRAPITTAYEYLETRFNLATRIYGSLVFVLFQVGRIAIVLYLPALVLSASTGLRMEFSIVAMGIITTIYTVLGGVEAVIWTDVVQSVVLVGGALLALFLAVAQIDGGWAGLSAMATAEGKTHWFNFATDYTTPAIWVCVLGNAFAMFYPSTADQTIVQRYLSTATRQAAARAVWTNALLTIPVSFLFFGLGTALWGYFKLHPQQLDPTLPTDAILPVFVMENFPVGLRSTLIAGVFAAAMSSLSASMNSLAAVAVNDYYRRFVPNLPEARALRAAKIITLLVGVFGTAMALVIAWLQVPSLFDQWLRWLGLIGGGLAGIMALGVFTTRGHGRGAVVGALASAAAVVWVQGTHAHFFLHGMVGFLSALLVGYLASWIIPRAK